jgi:hypothetical protein
MLLPERCARVAKRPGHIVPGNGTQFKPNIYSRQTPWYSHCNKNDTVPHGDGESEYVLTAADVIYCYMKWQKKCSDLVYVLTGRKVTD